MHRLPLLGSAGIATIEASAATVEELEIMKHLVVLTSPDRVDESFGVDYCTKNFTLVFIFTIDLSLCKLIFKTQIFEKLISTVNC